MKKQVESNYVFDECRDWFLKYQDAYKKLDRICSSEEGRKFSLSLDSKIKYVSDADNHMRYVFSLNLHSPENEIFIEGPRLSVANENSSSIQYLVAAMTDHYLAYHPDMSIRLKDFRGSLTDSKDNGGKRRFLAMDAMKDYQLSRTILGVISNHLLQFPNRPEIQKYYSIAQTERGEQDPTFIYSVDYSDTCFQKVLLLKSVSEKQ